jgi:hypothetical protein
MYELSSREVAIDDLENVVSGMTLSLDPIYRHGKHEPMSVFASLSTVTWHSIPVSRSHSCAEDFNISE